MHHRWRGFTIVMALGLALAACGGASSPSAAPSTGQSAGPSESMAAFEPMTYPVDGPAECGADNNPTNLSEIKAIDEHTVEFTLCNPDVAFLSKIAFSSLAIDDSDYLKEHGTNGSLVDEPNGTGPYMLQAWNRGSDITMTANPNYWGDPALTQTLVFRWSTEAAQRLVELQAGTADGIDNPGADDFTTIEDDPNLTLYEREGLNILYFGFNNTYPPFDNETVRQAIAMGIDRQRIVDNFYPPGSEVATHFTPCSIPFACEGEDWYEYDPNTAKQMLQPFLPMNIQIHLRDVVRSYLPAPQQVATDLQDQLNSLGITASIDIQESTAFIDNANAGALDGIHLLGWGADYPDNTNFLDFHFGSGATDQFGDKFDDITSALATGASTVDDTERAAAYETANNAIKEHVPMIPIAHGGSGTAFQANVEGAHSSPLGNENFSVMSNGTDQLVWIQNGEPGGLYCGDETDGESLRVCEQIKESLYAYETAGTATVPSLATECAPNDDLTVWTCTLREGVTFHNGAAFDANDVVASYAAQWDYQNPLHVGRVGDFAYWSAFFGGYLNPPPG
jgi:peptide/nickel transport system substrate-binding protein